MLKTSLWDCPTCVFCGRPAQHVIDHHESPGDRAACGKCAGELCDSFHPLSGERLFPGWFRKRDKSD